MAFDKTDRWVILRLRNDGEVAWLEYADSRGRQRRPHGELRGDDPDWPQRVLSRPLLDTLEMRPGIRVPADLDQLLDEAIATLPERYGPHANGPVPLPIFFAPLPTAVGLWVRPPWEEHMLNELWPGFDGNRVEAVRLARQRWTQRPRFRLPLRLLAIGPLADAVLANLRDKDWYQSSAETQQFGLQFKTVPVEEVVAALRATPYDVVVCEDSSAAEVWYAAGRLPQPALSRPRLVIQLSKPYFFPERSSLPAGLSLLRLPVPAIDQIAQFIKDFVYGIIHDYPLHEALKAAKRDAVQKHISDPRLPYEARLIADPASNNNLRLSEALAGLQEETFTISQTAARGDLPVFFSRMGADAPPQMRIQLINAFAPHEAVKKSLDETNSLKFSFLREDQGLVPLANAEAAKAQAKASADSIKAALGDFFNNPDYVEAMRKYQERRVDVALEALNEMSVYLPVVPDYTLKQGERYRLRVHIGQRADGSLVVGDVPPLDPLLPETEARGYNLEVAVFEKDLPCLGRACSRSTCRCSAARRRSTLICALRAAGRLSCASAFITRTTCCNRSC